MSRGLRFPIALHPFATDDSRRVLGSSPNRRGACLRRRFRRNLRRKQDLAATRPFLREPPKRLGNTGPATHGLRTSIKNTTKLAARRTECQASPICKGLVPVSSNRQKAVELTPFA